MYIIYLRFTRSERNVSCPFENQELAFEFADVARFLGTYQYLEFIPKEHYIDNT